MAEWDVQRDTRDNRIVAIRPKGYWAKHPEFNGDTVWPLQVKAEELGIDYAAKDAISLEKGGDGLTKTAKDIAAAKTIDDVLAVKPQDVAAKLTVAQLDAEIQARGYKPISLASAVAGKV